MKKIVFTIDETGAVSIDAQGYTGTSCKDATKAFEEALGAADAAANRHDKPEMKLGGGRITDTNNRTRQ